MRATRPLLGLLTALALAGGLSGCGTPEPDELVEALKSSGVPAAQAQCVVDAVEEVLDADDIEALVSRGASAAPRDDPNDPDDKADRLREAMAVCRELAVASTTTVPEAEATTPTIVGGVPGASTVPGDDASFDTTTPED